MLLCKTPLSRRCAPSSPAPSCLRRGRFLRLAVVSLVLASLCACSSEPQPAANLPLEVEYAGCFDVLREGSVCILPEDRELQLWGRTAADARLELTFLHDAHKAPRGWSEVGGRSLSATPVDGGWRVSVEVPRGAQAVLLRARTGSAGSGRDAASAEPWRLALAEPWSAPPWLERVREHQRAGELGAARQALREIVNAAAGTAAMERAVAFRRLLMLEALDPDAAAEDLLGPARQARREAGLVDGLREVALAVHGLNERRQDFADGFRILDSLDARDAAAAPADLRFLLPYYRGVLHAETGDHRAALRELTAAAVLARRVGLERRRWDVEQMRAWQLQVIGRAAEAEQLLDRLMEEADEDWQQGEAWADFLTNRAWVALLAREAGGEAVAPAPLLERALEEYDRSAARVEKRLNARINLAWADLQRGDVAAARRTLGQARNLLGDPAVLEGLWLLTVEGQLALAEGAGTASLERYRELAARSREASWPEGELRAAVGQARAFRELGKTEAAIEELLRAEELLDSQALRVSRRQGRETFVADRAAGTRLLLDLLLERGREREALAVARRSRARLLRDLQRGDRLAALGAEEHRRWTQAVERYRRLHGEDLDFLRRRRMLPADEARLEEARQIERRRELSQVLDEMETLLGGPPPRLLPLVPEELTLVFHPLPEGWVAFGAARGTVQAVRFSLPAVSGASPERLAEALLDPFHQAILDARRIRVLAYGDLRPVDFHALPFGGSVLVASKPVVYGLDTAPAADASAATGAGAEALVVVDPRGDLAGARGEGELVTQELEAMLPGQVETLRRGDAAAAAVLDRLSAVDLFHFAGHGVSDQASGWESALLLAGGEQLTPAELLVLDRAPRWVVLSGCHTAQGNRLGQVEAVGLAQAFLAVGSRQVVATTRPLDDQAGAELFADFYRRLAAAEPPWDLAQLLRETQLAARQRTPPADWASLRVLEP